MKIEPQFELTKRSEAMKGGMRSSLGQKASTLADASGGGTMAYLEQDRKTLRKQMGPESEYFKKEKRRAENARKRREKERREAAGE